MTNSSSYVGVACPKCSYIRTAEEGANDWECPSCGIVYAKFLKAAAEPAPVPQVPQAQESKEQVQESNPLVQKPKVAGVLAHLSTFILPGLLPAFIWLVEKDRNDFSVACAKESLNFHLSVMLIYLVVFILIAIINPLYFIGVITMLVYWVMLMVQSIIAAYRASQGEAYWYPHIFHFFK
jgi:uncharacterized Tic20 family protein